MNKIILNCETKSKHAIRRNLTQEEIDEIKEELNKLPIHKVMKKHAFNNYIEFGATFLYYTGITPGEYKHNSLEKKKINYDEFRTFFSQINSIDPFLFYVSINRAKIFGFLTTNGNTCIELKDMIHRHHHSIGVSLEGQSINNKYSGRLYEVLDKDMFLENYPDLMDKFKLNKFRVKYDKSSAYHIQEPIKTFKKLLEEIV